MTDRTKVPTEEFGFWKPDPKPKRQCPDCHGQGFVVSSLWRRTCDCILKQVEPRS